MIVTHCLVPRPQYFAAVNRFRGTSSGAKSASRICHRNQLTVKAWRKTLQGLGKVSQGDSVSK